MIILIDTLALLHRAYHAVKELSDKDGKPAGAVYGLISSLLRVIREFKPDHIIACYDGPEDTVRHEIMEDYKGTRSLLDDDLIEQIERSKEILKALGIHVVEKKGYEADDIIGSLSSDFWKKGMDSLIFTCDSDLLQLVNEKVKVSLLKRGLSENEIYDEEKVFEKYGFSRELIPDYKGLAGDASDNIKGVSTIGEKRATDLIKAFGTVEDIYKALEKDEENFIKKGFTKKIADALKTDKESAFLSKNLATIHTDLNIGEKYINSKKWIDLINKEEATSQLKRLGFRGLLERLNSLIGEGGSENDEEIDEEKLREASVALWVLNEEFTDASYEEILSYTETENLDSALNFIKNKLKEKGLISVWEKIEYPLIPVIAKMEKNGIQVDKNKLKVLSGEFNKRIDVLEKKIYDLSGEEFNINSPKQLGVILFDKLKIIPPGSSKTKRGAKSTKESVLLSIEKKHEIVPKVLEYRHLKKITTTYIDNFPKYLDKNDRLHTTLLQNGTVTGRFSSRDPNLQNIPINTKDGRRIREAFVVKDGYTLVGADYQQIELKIAAILSGDKILLETFKKEDDIHRSIASRIFDVEESEVDSDMRRNAKTINFGVLYGMGVSSLKKSLNISTEEAEKFLGDYKKTFTKLIEYLDSLKKKAREDGYVETAFGRRRYIPGIHSKLPFIVAQAERIAINAPIQGTEADVIKIAMINLSKALAKYGDDVLMVLQIHDELLFEVKNELVDQVKVIIKEEMESVFPKDKKPIPISVSVRKGGSWDDLE